MCAWKTILSETVFETPWIKVRKDEVITPAGTPGQYGVVEFKNRAVGVVPITAAGQIVMVRQTRYAIGNVTSLEIPEGGAPEGEDWLETARRELQEETGYQAAHIEPLLTGFHMSNSVTTELGALFVATGLTAGETELEDSEDIEVELHSYDEVMRMISSGAITDGLTIMAMLCIATQKQKYGL